MRTAQSIQLNTRASTRTLAITRARAHQARSFALTASVRGQASGAYDTTYNTMHCRQYSIRRSRRHCHRASRAENELPKSTSFTRTSAVDGLVSMMFSCAAARSSTCVTDSAERWHRCLSFEPIDSETIMPWMCRQGRRMPSTCCQGRRVFNKSCCA